MKNTKLLLIIGILVLLLFSLILISASESSAVSFDEKDSKFIAVLATFLVVAISISAVMVAFRYPEDAKIASRSPVKAKKKK